MFEKIKAKLLLQRGTDSNVSDRSIEDLAKSLETVITTDDILEKADLTAAIKSIDGNINHYTAEAVKKSTTEAKQKIKDDAEAKQKIKDDDAAAAQQQTEEIPAWAKTVMEQNQKMADDLNSMQTEKTTSTRRDQLKKQLKDLPEYYTKPILSAFDSTSFEDEDTFSTYLNGIKTNGDDFQQQLKEKGLNTTPPRKDVEIPEDTEETPVLADARKMANDQKEKQKDAK